MKKLIVFLCMIQIIFITGCKKFDNLNPNVPARVNPSVMLPQIMFSTSNSLVNSAFELNNELIQYTCMNNTFTEVQRFKLLPDNSNGMWNLYNRMRDLDDIIRMSEEGVGLENYKAIALIIKSYLFTVITDAYGDVPYSEAIKASIGQLYSPKYDSQKDIYTSVLQQFKDAEAMIDVNKGLPLGGDVMFGGQMLKWKKFANSLRLRSLMRVSARAEMNAGDQIRALLADPVKYPLMDSNGDNALYKYSGSLPDVFPLSLALLQDFTFKYKSVSAFLVDSLKKFNDDRLTQYARPTNATAGTANPQYVGLPNSLPVTESANYNGGQNNQSYIGTRFQKSTEPAIWQTWSEVLFLRAEAVMKGYSTGNAKDLYEQAIRASYEYWGASLKDGYLLQPGVSFDGSFQKLYLQKFLALYFTGNEAWYEYRRTGFPLLVPGPANNNNGKVPVRLPYPLDEQTLNGKNYKDAATRIGGDNMNTKVWWQP